MRVMIHVKRSLLVWLLCATFGLSFAIADTAETEFSVTLSLEEKAWLRSNPVARVAAQSDWAPFDFIGTDGAPSGISWDLLSLISKKTGLEFQAVESAWVDSLELVKSGDVDILPAVYQTQAREDYLLFSSSYYKTLDYFFLRSDLELEQIDGQTSLRVAIPSGFANAEYIESNFPNMEIVYVDTIGQAIDAVVERQADALYDTYVVIKYWLEKDGIRSIRPFQSARNKDDKLLHFATRKSAPLLASILQKGLDSISLEQRRSVFNGWLNNHTSPVVGSFSLSSKEKAWLEQYAELNFAGDPNWLPYEAYDGEEYVGIVADYLKLIESRLGIRLNKVQTENWSESVELVRQGKIDVLSETRDSTLSEYMSFTQSYTSSPIVIVMHEDTAFVDGLDQIQDQRIGMIKQYGYVETIRNAYPEIAFLEVASIQDGLLDVSTQKKDALLATAAQASFHISALGLNNIRIVGRTEFSTELSFGVKKELSGLVPLLNRAIADISEAEKQAILRKWGDYKYVERTNYLLIAKITIAFVVFIIAVLLWNRKLAHEITLRKSAEEQLRALLDNLPMQVVVNDYSGQCLLANPKFLEDYNIDAQELRSFNLSHYYSEKGGNPILKELKENKLVRNTIVEAKLPSGIARSMMVSVIPIHYGSRPAFLSIAVDITDRVAMEAELKTAKDRAEIANRSKSAFLANMSHEIRTPMNAIVGFSELLNDKLQDETLRSYANVISSSCNDLLVLIDDILDLSKIESGKMEITPVSVDIRSLLDDLVEFFRETAIKKKIGLELEVDSSVPQELMLDVSRFRQILINLVGNAIKFTELGKVSISVEAGANNQNVSNFDVSVKVRDTGIGIPEHQLEDIFADFQQADGQDHGRYGGTGLGLAICRKLTKLMGGKLSVTSREGSGSTFTVALNNIERGDISTKHSRQNINDIDVSFEPCEVLIVDDVQSNRLLLAEHLTDTNINVTTAVNGLEAVNCVKSQEPSLVLMDLRMPVRDGYWAAKEIRRFSNVPIVALTASVMKDELDSLKIEHFNDYLRKPYSKSALFDKLKRFLKTRENVAQEREELSYDGHAELNDASDLKAHASEMLSLLESWARAIEENNIGKSESFWREVNELATKTQFRPLMNYSKELRKTLDLFDVIGIERSLQLFGDLCESWGVERVDTAVTAEEF